MNIKELRQLSNQELQARVRELKDELLHLRLRQASGQLEKTHLPGQHRKEVARCLTILREREDSATVEPQTTRK
jgi:large subunit ribosomal protein L29